MPRPISLFFRRNHSSSEIRGRQVGLALGARLNPTENIADDLCILVKFLPKSLLRERGLQVRPDQAYIDIIDYTGGLPWFRTSSRHVWPLIASSRSAEAYLRATYKNPVVYIPHHHCNYERLLRDPKPVKTVAYVGLMGAGPPPWFDRMNTAIAKMGLEMRYFTEFRCREDVVVAYRQTDIQFTWYDNTMIDRLRQMKTALKVVNAASFGIPTVSSFEPAYMAECRGFFVPCDTLDSALEAIRELKKPATYEAFTKGLPAFAEPYHIDNIIKLYQGLAQ